MIKGAIFDMDGVLVDNGEVHFEAFRQFSRKYGIEVTTEQLRSVFGMGNDDIFRVIFPAELIERVGLKQLGDDKEVLYRSIYKPVIPNKGLHALLRDLADAGIDCSVGSSGPTENVEYVLNECQIAPFFKHKINGDMVVKRKPDPEIFIKAVEALGFAPEECVVFEDSLSGVEAARRAGTHVVALTTTYPADVLREKVAPDYIINDFTEISSAKLQELFG